MDYLFPSKLYSYVLSKLNFRYKFYPLKFYFKHKSNIRRDDEDVFIRNINFFYFENIENYRNSSDYKEILDEADKALAHNFSVLGSQLTHFDDIVWNKDIKTKFIWENKFYKDIKCVDLHNSADVKVPWELSRCHHLLYLGEAYLMTKKKEYAEETVFQIKDWIKKNPVMYSVNWTCSMEVAIRAVNWLYSLIFIADSGLITDSFAKLVLRSLYEHAFFIYNNLERSLPYNGNHYTSDIVGLLYLGWVFKETKEGKKWFDFAVEELKADIRLQVLPCGMHYERSISYHRLMTELYLYSLIFLDHIGCKITDVDINLRVKKMIRFIDVYTKKNGTSPLIGDNDNGRFLPFTKRDFLDHRYLLSVGSSYFNESYINQPNNIIDTLFLNLQEKKKIIYKLKEKDHLFEDAGLCFVRRKNINFVLYNTGISKYIRKGKKVIGTHTHLDALSFEFCYKGLDFIIDPGSYVYTASKADRDKFMSTQMHNTAVIDNSNQYKLSDRYFFNIESTLIPVLNPQPIVMDEVNNESVITSSFVWNRINDSVIQKRKIKIGEDAILIEDSFNSTNNHEIKLYFHFHPEVEIIQKGNLFYLKRENVTLQMIIKCSGKANLSDDFVSFSYGVKTKAKVLCYTVDLLKEVIIKTKIGCLIQ